MAAWMAKGERAAGYRRRRPLPAIAFLVVLLLVAGVVWVALLKKSPESESALACNPPDGAAAKAVPARRTLPRNALDNVAPVPASRVRVTVFNGAGQRGAAGLVTLTMQELGFTRIGQPEDDPLYPKQDLHCRAEIRFGRAGAVAARTVSLIEPCAVLVRDDRRNTTVDLAIGEKFDDLDPGDAGKKILKLLADGATVGGAGGSGGEQSESDSAGGIDPALLQQARDVTC